MSDRIVSLAGSVGTAALAADQIAYGEGMCDSPIIIIDDSETIRTTLKVFLERAGFTNIRTFEDGQSAFRTMETRIPDLVITDIYMPELSGVDLCRLMRADERLRTIPVLVHTRINNPFERADIFAAGATDVISKPVNLRELLGRVRVHLEQRSLVRQLSAHREAMRQDLSVAREMQSALLPSHTTIAGIEAHYPLKIASMYQASQDLGGDFWGIWGLRHGIINLAMADFAGHGISAALNTFRLHTYLRNPTLGKLPPDEVLAFVNSFLFDVLPRGQYATFAHVRFDMKNHCFEMASAAAPPPLLDIGGKGEYRALPSAGLPLGLVSEVEYEVRNYPFPPGSTMILYSDALVDTPLAPEAVFDTESLLAFVNRLDPGLPPEGVIARIRLALTPHLPDDDLTLVVIRHEEKAP